MVKAYLISNTCDVFTSIAKVTIHNWRDYSKLLDCDLFDVVRVEWGGKDISLYVDDEGMLKENYGRRVEGYPEPLFGNIIVTGGVDSEGNTLSIPDDIIVSEHIGQIEYKIKG